MQSQIESPLICFPVGAPPTPSPPRRPRHPQVSTDLDSNAQVGDKNFSAMSKQWQWKREKLLFADKVSLIELRQQ
jgi:hypothetical protein